MLMLAVVILGAMASIGLWASALHDLSKYEKRVTVYIEDEDY